MTISAPNIPKFIPQLCSFKRVLLAVSSAWVLAASPLVLADEFADVTKLVRSGHASEAMLKIDAFLAKNPRDMQMRFVRGVVLTEQGKTAEAITVFTKLTEDHPDLPEPYNNLAVLFAASGQYDKARAALDMAIRTNPSYATAYENLGDVHAKLASQAYDKALQLDSGNANAKSKLTLLRSLAGNNAKDIAAVKGSAVKGANTPAPVVVARVDAPKIEANPEPKSVVKVTQTPDVKPMQAKPESKPVVIAKVEAKPEPKPVVKVEAKPEVKPEAKPESKPAAASVETGEVLVAVNDWAAAWSSQDVKRYLGHYANDFETPKGISHKAWADERTARIVGKGRINVKVELPRVSVNGNVATVKFRQVYSSDRLQADSRKTLLLSKKGGKWQIKQERTGS